MLRLVSASVLLLLGVTALAEERRLDVDGVKVRFTVAGKGEPVVLVHGFGGSAEFNWGLPGTETLLVKQHRVIALDLRGHGLSGKPRQREAYGIEMVNDVLRVLDELKIDKAHVVGYSMGGFVTLKLLAEHPERVISAIIGGSGGVREDFDYRWSERFAEKLEGGASFRVALFATLPDDVKAQEHPPEMVEAFFKNHDPAALAAVLRSWRGLSVTYDKLQANKVPTLVIYGSDEEQDRMKYIASLEGRMANAEFKLIDGVDHLTTLNSPEFQDSIAKFLAAHAAQ